MQEFAELRMVTSEWTSLQNPKSEVAGTRGAIGSNIQDGVSRVDTRKVAVVRNSDWSYRRRSLGTFVSKEAFGANLERVFNSLTTLFPRIVGREITNARYIWAMHITFGEWPNGQQLFPLLWKKTETNRSTE